MFHHELACVIITYNEENNIGRVLSALTWVPQILIVDSGSTDKTIEIARRFKNVQIIVRPFDTFANQCNFGLRNLVSEWILSLDADYVVSEGLREEIKRKILDSRGDVQTLCGYSVPFKYCINGKPIRSGLLPRRVCLYKRAYAEYEDEGHSHRVRICGRIGQLHNVMYHDDRKPISVWFESQLKYQAQEAKMLAETSTGDLPIQDRVRKYTCLTPFIQGFLSLVFRGGILDGKEGVIYAFQRIIAESLLFLFMHVKNPHTKENEVTER